MHLTALICLTVTTLLMASTLRVKSSRDDDAPRWAVAIAYAVCLFVILVPFLYFWYSYFGGMR